MPWPLFTGPLISNTYFWEIVTLLKAQKIQFLQPLILVLMLPPQHKASLFYSWLFFSLFFFPFLSPLFTPVQPLHEVIPFVPSLLQTISYLHWLQFSIKDKNLTLVEGPIESSIWDLRFAFPAWDFEVGKLRGSLEEVAKHLSQKSFKAENMLTPRLWGWAKPGNKRKTK